MWKPIEEFPWLEINAFGDIRRKADHLVIPHYLFNGRHIVRLRSKLGWVTRFVDELVWKAHGRFLEVA